MANLTSQLCGNLSGKMEPFLAQPDTCACLVNHINNPQDKHPGEHSTLTLS